MASVVGKWKIQGSQNFEEYMKAIGIYVFIFNFVNPKFKIQ